MNTLRTRLERMEQALGRPDAQSERERSETLVRQLNELSDTELNRLEVIVARVAAIAGDTEDGIPIPTECGHLRDFIAFVDRDEDAYFAAVAEASNA